MKLLTVIELEQLAANPPKPSKPIPKGYPDCFGAFPYEKALECNLCKVFNDYVQVKTYKDMKRESQEKDAETV